MYPRFVDRVVELEELVELAERDFNPTLFIYGPEGCGKTRLLRELVARLRGRGFLAVYVDAQSTRSLEEVVEGPRELVEALTEAVAGLAGPAGRLAALAATRLSRKLAKRRVEGARLAVVVDDVARPVGLDVVEAYAKDLLNLVEELYGLGASSVLAVASTSEGLSRSLLARHSYVRLRELWNLGLEAAEELMENLGAPRQLRSEAWRLTGGNPRAIVELSRRGWRTHQWLKAVEASLKTLLDALPSKLKTLLAKAVEDVDSLIEEPELSKALIEANLVTPIDRPCLGYTPSPDPDLGVGQRYAWQLPAYKGTIAKLMGIER